MAEQAANRQRVPNYERIARDIREEIRAGVLRPDEAVPSAAALCEQYSVSMITTKKALNILRSEGMVYAIAGKGTFVAANRRMIRTAPQRYFRRTERTYVQEAEQAGQTPRAEHETALESATSWMAQRVEIETGDSVMVTRYRILADERPMSMSVSWEPLAITGGTVIEHPHDGLYANSGLNSRFAAIGWTIEQVEEHLIVRPPEPTEKSELTIPPDVHVVEIRQTVRAVREGTDNLVPVEAADIIFPADRYEFRYLMDRPQ